MKTLKNLSVIILFVGIIFLTVYITKSHYAFNDMQYNEIVNKLLKEEKRRVLDNQLEIQKGIPTKLFNTMFSKPSPWMGYTDNCLPKKLPDGNEK